MSQFREVDLPGVGKKYSFTSFSKEHAVVIIHHDGRREFYILDRDEEPLASITLHDDEARRLGAVMSGVFFKPKAVENLEVALEGLRIEWYKVTPDSPVVGRTIGQLEIRKKTGVSVIAVIRSNSSIPNPGADLIFESGDTVVVLGKPEGFAPFHRLISPQ